MPPKRGRGRTSTRGRSASRAIEGSPFSVNGSRETTPVLESNSKTRRAVAPSRFSSSYGSSPIVNPTRHIVGSNAGAAVGAVLESIKAEEEDDLQSRSGRELSYDDGPGLFDGMDDSMSMPPPPCPTRRDSKGPRAASVQVADQYGTKLASKGRKASEPPQFDTVSQRSFREESQIYSDAALATPEVARAAQSSQPLESPGVRQSARIAARNSVTREVVAARPSSSRATASPPRQPAPVSDSIDDDDEEDPLLNPSPRGLRKDRRSVSAASPDLSDRIRRARLNRGPRALSVSDEGEFSDDDDDDGGRTAVKREAFEEKRQHNAPLYPQIQHLVPRNERPHPVQAARSNELLLPRPDHTAKRRSDTEPSLDDKRPKFLGNGYQGKASATQNGFKSSAASAPQHVERTRTRSPYSNHSMDRKAARFSAPPVPQIPNPANRASSESSNLFAWSLDKFLHMFCVDKWPSWLGRAFQAWGLLVLLSWLFLILLEVAVPASTWEGVQVDRHYTLHGLSHWRQNIAQFVPWIILNPFAVLTGNLDYADFRNQLNKVNINNDNNFGRLNLLNDSVNEMRRILPELIAIKVDKHSDTWAVEDAFWHAMNAEMKRGGLLHSVLTLEKMQNGSFTISDPHWNAIASRIQSEGLLRSNAAAPNSSDFPLTSKISDYIDQSMSTSWSEWLRKNEEAINRAQGSKQAAPSPRWQDLYGDVDKAISHRLEKLGLQERVISQDEFIRELQQQSSQYAAEIKNEMEAIQERVNRALELAEAAKAAPEVPEGMTHSQVKAMIDEIVHRSIAKAQLESLAKGHIKAGLDSGLLRQKDYFTGTRGAIIDTSLTSGSYSWAPKSSMKERKGRWFRWPSWSLVPSNDDDDEMIFPKGGKDAGVLFSADKVLRSWDEDGDCWCAGIGGDDDWSRAARVSVILADTVIPQHLVVEHIAAHATFDPTAMPKDIEVWIRAPTDKRSRTLRHWSKQRFSSSSSSSSLDETASSNTLKIQNQGYIKVGEFRYDSDPNEGESQIFKLPEELLNMDAQTQQVLVRARTNYGSEDHTCFYRLRLWGQGPKDL
ncbi:hypothetical protein BD289DRAFT_486791 [Coniella lustricola]|uniref:SUN domain-containing protein n=1 Tax=Coniella lustricola TaxID=2025994 RepID=A0A2T2ZTZ3_9PEZI|nr:hypothetical protein BD289DRAFT_486791 [Coniella lustricola]